MKGKGALDRRILKLALPAIANNITVPLLGLSDSIIAGHLGTASAVGAMAVGAMMLNVVYWLCGFLRAGTTGLTAQAFGAGDGYLCRDILKKGLATAAMISVAVLALQIPLAAGLLALLAPGAEVAAPASLYFSICVWAVPAQLAMMAASGWFIGLQNTAAPMAVAVGVNVLNIALSMTLTFGFGMGFAGIAIGTLAANWAGAAALLLYASRYRRRLPEGNAGRKVEWRRLFSVNTYLFFRSGCIISVSLAVTAIGSRLGDDILAGNAVMMQFFIFFSYFMDGFAFAGEGLVGAAYGARDSRTLHATVTRLLQWGAVMAVTFGAVYLFASRGITALITDGPEVRKQVDSMAVWVVALPPVTVCAFLFDGIFIGLARMWTLLWTTMAATAVFFAVALCGASPGAEGGNAMLWLGFEAYLFMRGLLLGLEYLKIRNKSLTL